MTKTLQIISCWYTLNPYYAIQINESMPLPESVIVKARRIGTGKASDKTSASSESFLGFFEERKVLENMNLRANLENGKIEDSRGSQHPYTARTSRGPPRQKLSEQGVWTRPSEPQNLLPGLIVGVIL